MKILLLVISLMFISSCSQLSQKGTMIEVLNKISLDEMRKYEDVTDPASGSTYSQCITYGLNCRVK